MRSITAKIDQVTAIPTPYRAAIIPAPPACKIELTGRCNFACSFCARSNQLRGVGDMDLDFFKRVCREMVEAGVKELGLFYLGESFMVSWLPDAIYYAKRIAGFEYTFLTTNGSLATPQRVQDCMEAGLDSLKFSLNYADAEQFASITRVKPALFNKMLGNIKSARRVRDGGGHECGLYASFIEYTDAQAGLMGAVVDEIRPYLDEVYALPLFSQLWRAGTHPNFRNCELNI
jgi:pyruvate formate-lyase activating enzyme-like uncharacterized protein